MKKLLTILFLFSVAYGQVEVDSTKDAYVPDRDGIFKRVPSTAFGLDKVRAFELNGEIYERFNTGTWQNNHFGIYANGANQRAKFQAAFDSSYVDKMVITNDQGGAIFLQGDSIDFHGKTLEFEGNVYLKGNPANKTKLKNVLIVADPTSFIIDTSFVLGENVRFTTGEFSVKNFGAGKDRTFRQNMAIITMLNDYAGLYKGQTIFFPGDNYLVGRRGTKMIPGKSYTTYKGEGMYKTKLTLDTADYYNFRRIFDLNDGDSSITIKDMGFNMNLKGIYYDSVSVDFEGDPGEPAGDYQCLPIFTYSTDSTKAVFDVRIENIYAENIPGDVVGISKNTNYVHIKNIRFRNYIRQGISLGGGNVRDVWIEDVFDLGSTTVLQVGGHSIHCEPSSIQWNINYLNSTVRDFSYSGVGSGSIIGITTTSNNDLLCNLVSNTEISDNTLNGRLQVSANSRGNIKINNNRELNAGVTFTTVSGASGSPAPSFITGNKKIIGINAPAIQLLNVDSITVSDNNVQNTGDATISSGNCRSTIITRNRVKKNGTGNYPGIYTYSTTTSNYGAGMDYIDGNIVESSYRGIVVGNKSAIIGPSNVVTAPTPYELSTAKIFPYRGPDGRQTLVYKTSGLPNYNDWVKGDVIIVNTTTAGEPTKYICDTTGALHRGNWNATGPYYRNEYVRDSTNGRVYRSKASNGQNELPSADTDNTYWEQVATRTAVFSAVEYYRQLLSGFGAPTMTNNIAIGTEYIRKDGDSCTTKYIYTVSGWRPNSGCGGPGGGLSEGQVADQIRDSLTLLRGNDTIIVVFERPELKKDSIELVMNGSSFTVFSPADSTFKGTVAQLRANNTTRFRTATTTDFGTGQWYLDASDASSTDNTGTIIVDAAGKRWKRQRDGGDVRIEWFTTSKNLTTIMPALIAAVGNKSRIVMQADSVYTITKDSTLRFNKKGLIVDFNGSTIRPDSSYTAIAPQADSITIKNFTIDLNFKSHNGVRGTGYKGLWLNNYFIKNQHKKSNGQTGGVFLVAYGNVYSDYYTARQLNNSDTALASHSPAFKVDGGYNVNLNHHDYDTVGVGNNLVSVNGGNIDNQTMKNVDDNGFYFQGETKNINFSNINIEGVEEGIVHNTGLTNISNITGTNVTIKGATLRGVTFRTANTFFYNGVYIDSSALGMGQSSSYVGVKNGDINNFSVTRTLGDRAFYFLTDTLMRLRNGTISGFATLNSSAIRIASSDSITIENVTIPGDGVNLQYGIRHASGNNTFSNNNITRVTGSKIRNDGGTNIKSIDPEEISSTEKYKIQAAKGFVYTKLTYAQMQAISSPESMAKVCATDSNKCYTYISGAWKEDGKDIVLDSTRTDSSFAVTNGANKAIIKSATIVLAGALAAKDYVNVNRIERRANFVDARSISKLDTAVDYTIGQRRFYYDPNDNSSADDTAMTIVTTGGGRLKQRIEDGRIYPEYWGAKGDSVTNDSKAFNLMFRWIEQNYRRMYIVGHQHKVYLLNDTVFLPISISGGGKFSRLKIEGDGVTYRKTNSGVMLYRMSTSVTTATNTDITSYTLSMTGLTLQGQNLSGQTGMKVSSMYGAEIKNCSFVTWDTAVVAPFWLKCKIEDNFFQQNFSVPFKGCSGVGYMSGANTSNSAFNANVFSGNRWFHRPETFTGLMILAGDANIIEKCITEGANPVYDFYVDDQNSSVVNAITFRDIWFESYGASVNTCFYLNTKGVINVSGIQNDYNDTLFNITTDGLGGQMNVSDVQYIPNGLMLFKQSNLGSFKVMVSNCSPTVVDAFHAAARHASGTVDVVTGTLGYIGTTGNFGLRARGGVELTSNPSLGAGNRLIQFGGNIKFDTDNAYVLGSYGGVNFRPSLILSAGGYRTAKLSTYGFGFGDQNIVPTQFFKDLSDSLLLIQSTGAIRMPTGTTAQRPTRMSTTQSMLRYNRESKRYEYDDSTTWRTIMNSPFTTTGDIVYWNGTAEARLGIGITGQILKVSGGLPSWQNEPVFSISKNATRDSTILKKDGVQIGAVKDSTGGSVDTTTISTKANVIHQINQAVDNVSDGAPSRAVVANITSSGVTGWLWSRNGKVVHGSGYISVTPSSANTLTEISLSFPTGYTPSAVDDVRYIHGGGTFFTGTDDFGSVYGQGRVTSTTGGVQYSFKSVSTSEHKLQVWVEYALP